MATSPEQALERVKRALRARRYHSDDCMMWDYEGNNGCPDCDACDEDVRSAKAAYVRVCGAAGRIA